VQLPAKARLRHSTWPTGLIIRVISVPKILPELYEEILLRIFKFLIASYIEASVRHRAVTPLKLTCQQWKRLTQLFVPNPDLLDISLSDLELIESIDFKKKTLNFPGTGNEKEFSEEAWNRYRRSFCEALSMIPLPGYPHIARIHFDGCFTSFDPFEWSKYLQRCFTLRELIFESEKCSWDDIEDFLIRFQTLSEVVLQELVLIGVSARSQRDCQHVELSHANQRVGVESLEISKISFTDISSNILPVISPDLKKVRFHKTSFSLSCALKLLDFLSSSDSLKLSEIDCSLMSPEANEELSFIERANPLFWPQAYKCQGIFSSLLLTNLKFDGGAFATTVIISQDISLFGRIVNLQKLALSYCLSDSVDPLTFLSLLEVDEQWISLESLRITFPYGDPNWEKEAIALLVRSLKSQMRVELMSGPHDYEFAGTLLKIKRKNLSVRFSFRLKIGEGGNEGDYEPDSGSDEEGFFEWEEESV
jgi:hypothetical protein